MKKIGIYVAAGAMALFGFKALLNKNKPHPKPVVTENENAKETTPKVVTKPTTKPRGTKKSFSAKNPQESGLSVLQAFKAQAGSISFSIKTENVGCSLGDFNMMAADASMRGSKSVLLSVEALSINSRPLLTEKVLLNDFVKGREWVVPVPKKLSDVPLGVFICSDKAGTGRCMSKNVKDVNELWTIYQSASGGKGKYPADDYVLMFQYLHRRGEGVSFLPADALHHFGGDKVKSTLVALNGNDSNGRRIANDVYRYLDVLKPMPGRLKQDAIIFPLPNGQCR